MFLKLNVEMDVKDAVGYVMVINRAGEERNNVNFRYLSWCFDLLIIFYNASIVA